jgi:hypothetical protein
MVNKSDSSGQESPDKKRRKVAAEPVGQEPIEIKRRKTTTVTDSSATKLSKDEVYAVSNKCTFLSSVRMSNDLRLFRMLSNTRKSKL